MRVYVLSTGRCGEKTLAVACSYMSNYSLRDTADASSSIVIDKHLVRIVHDLDDSALFVHLQGNAEHTASIYQRYGFDAETVALWSSKLDGSISTNPRESSLDACREYVERANADIAGALAKRPNRLDINTSSMADDFKVLWQTIEAQGDLDAAFALLDIQTKVDKLLPLFPPPDSETSEDNVI